MRLADVMDELADILTAIPSLSGRSYGWPRVDVTPPAAVVDYPPAIDFDATYRRGQDRLTFSVVVIVGQASDRAARDNLSTYVDGSGAESVKQVLESVTDPQAFDSLRVVSADIDDEPIGDIEYLTATFEVDVVGPGNNT